MATQCFKKPLSNPPTCGVHNQLLQSTQSSASNIGTKFFVCSASGHTVQDGDWYEYRNQHPYCVQDQVQLRQAYEVTGTFHPPTYECPTCKRKTML
jgi:hypothetical protein